MSAASFIPFDLGTAATAAHPAADCSKSVAGRSATDDGFGDWGKGADFRQFLRERETSTANVAVVATVAEGKAFSHPWGAGLAQLRSLPAPSFMDPARWDGLVFVAVQLAEQWGEKAHALGWDTLHLFGCNADPRTYRSDRSGLAPLLARWAGPIRVLDVEADSIPLGVLHGGVLRYRRFPLSGAVPLWQAYAMEGGP